MSEKMFKCPYCKYQFGEYGIYIKQFKGICPRCNHEEKILFKWINPEYKLRKEK